MSWRTVVITTRCKLDLKMGYMVVRGEDTKRIFLDEIAVLLIKKTLLNKVIAELEKAAISPEHYVKTQELLAEIDRTVDEWAFSFPCDIISSKISVPTLLKAIGIEIKNEYEGQAGEVEKILDYMELVREFDRDKLFITVNMRTYFDDSIMKEFLKTVSSHEFKVLMLKSQSYPLLDFEKRTTIDSDLCEF